MTRNTLTTGVETLADMKSDVATEDSYLALHTDDDIVLMVADGAPQRLRTTAALGEILAEYGPDTTPGRYAALLTRAVAAQYAHTGMDVRQIALEANARLHAKLAGIYGTLTAEAVLAREPELIPLRDDPRLLRLILPVCCVTLARYDLHTRRLTFAHGGDTALFLLHENGSTTQVTPDQMGPHDDQVRREIRRIQRETGRSGVEGIMPYWEQIHRLDVSNGIYHNYTDEQGSIDAAVGVGVINGLPQLDAYLFSGAIETAGVESILVSSDGFFWPSVVDETPAQQAERINGMGRMIRERGLAGYLQALRAEEQADAAGVRYQRFGKADDATAVLLRL